VCERARERGETMLMCRARARFLVETLVNVKNGKGKTGNGVEQSNEAAARMKKFLSGLGRKRRR